ncbi:STAS domain-containing protein [Streptomyces decoyicus]|uniref:Anti-sigma factor antagonist n=1 Tax=Streptomyces decoyicus TaxID=249567 RepID=A0ABZ1F9R4_9ACTN|nr:STAS domain-containing protein [Streptomyces decoyicus]WSB66828.1 STAS domain-containing protein [Streptomyces decoyicus]
MTEPNALNVEVNVTEPEVAVVTVSGDLDGETGTSLHHQLANQIVHGRRYLVLDLRAVPFMDSSGLNIIIRASNETKRLDGSLHLAAVSDVVLRLLDLTGISVTTPVHASPEDALAEIASRQAAEPDPAEGFHSAQR